VKRLVLIGPPGSGKGTQAEALRDRLGLLHVSTGDALREAVRQDTELGRQASEIMRAGRLVPDEIVAGIVEERLAREDCRGERFLLDGFPRTERQAALLDGILQRLGAKLDRVLLLDVPEDELVGRLSARRSCGRCGAVFHLIASPPREEGRCDACGGPLEQRSDDRPEVIRERLAVYRRETVPLVELYRRRELLAELDGTGGPETVLERLLEALGESGS
jgi:adenylate kinase